MSAPCPRAIVAKEPVAVLSSPTCAHHWGRGSQSTCGCGHSISGGACGGGDRCVRCGLGTPNLVLSAEKKQVGVAM